MAFAPDFHEGELFCSALARYCARMGYRGHVVTLRAIFGTPNASLTIDLPSGLTTFVDQLPPGTPIDVGQIIDGHTLFPVYAPFLNRLRHRRVRLGMKGLNRRGYLRWGNTSNRISNARRLRFCPCCAKEDQKLHGETFWHRVHQIDGIEVCLKHHVFLEDAVSICDKTPVTPWIPADNRFAEVAPRQLRPADSDHRKLVAIANQLSWLLNSGYRIRGREHPWRHYRELVCDRGFESYRGRIDFEKLEAAICSHYGSKLIETFTRCALQPGRLHWLRDLVLSCDHYVPPLHHLLLINFLGYQLDHFLIEVLKLPKKRMDACHGR